jgi:acetoin utilization protein AcuC
MKDLIIIHDPEYGNWVFDHLHPTQGRRFINGYNALIMHANAEGLTHETRKPHIPQRAQLTRIHDIGYVSEVVDHYKSGEWHGERPDMARLAQLFVGGTLNALDALRNGDTLTAVNLPGAKHHAARDASAGFCVFADFAIAAHDVVDNDGLRVAILDVDGHHGDGTEALTYYSDSILTYSIHQHGIYPGTGLTDQPDRYVYNWPLRDGAGNRELHQAIGDFLDVAGSWRPHYVFVTGGADGHRLDPLTGLTYTVDGLETAMQRVREAFPVTPILFGGAGGYQPDGATPLAWARMVTALAS